MCVCLVLSVFCALCVHVCVFSVCHEKGELDASKMYKIIMLSCGPPLRDRLFREVISKVDVGISGFSGPDIAAQFIAAELYECALLLLQQKPSLERIE